MTEEQKYDVETEYDGWEVRRYPAHLVAEVNAYEAGSIRHGSRAFFAATKCS